VNVSRPTTIHGSRQIGTATRACTSGTGWSQAARTSASQLGTPQHSPSANSRVSESMAWGTVSITVTHTGTPAARSRCTSMRRFSSLLAITRSGARAMIAARSGFLVPRTRVTASPAGWVHQSVAPTSAPGRVSATDSVNEGTSDTTRRAGPPTGTPVARSSRTATPLRLEAGRGHWGALGAGAHGVAQGRLTRLRTRPGQLSRQGRPGSWPPAVRRAGPART
jgi:hypothetical protein